MIHPERIKNRGARNKNSNGTYVLYWMQQSQRVLDNHALEYGCVQANELNVPLLVLFVVTPDFPEANSRHYMFMLQGLRHTARQLSERGIGMTIRIGDPVLTVSAAAEEAKLVVTDRGYLRLQRQWRDTLSRHVDCPIIEIESDVVVPVETVSEKEQYSAATIRPRIHRNLAAFLHPVSPVPVRSPSMNTILPGSDQLELDIRFMEDTDLRNRLQQLKVDREVSPVEWISGGTGEALKILKYFLTTHLSSFHDKRNDPAGDLLSNMSPFLHFGQLSPITIALHVMESCSRWKLDSGTPPPPLESMPPSAGAYLEELIVRRELSMNFVNYNSQYDSLGCLNDWAKKTIRAHARDERPVYYPLEQLEAANTHDEYWNAAQKEMVCRGKMHGYMRMYWGKKIIEWSGSAEEAHAAMVYLNNKYFLDGRDANGYTGIAWCFGKHDRAWKEREIFGKLRYMNARGLERKFQIEEYVNRISREWKNFSAAAVPDPAL